MSNPLQQTIEALAKEKGIEPDVVISAIEEAVATASRKYYKTGENLKTRFNTDTGQVDLFALKQVVQEVDQPGHRDRASTRRAQMYRQLYGDEVANSIELGDEMEFPKPTEVLGRIAAQTAKQVIFQKVREAERENIFAEYNQRIGDVVNGTVKRFENGDIILEIGRIEAVLPRKEQSRAESYSPADRVRDGDQGRQPQRQGAADRALAHRSGAAHQAVRAGSARDLRRHRDDPRRRARSGRPRQGRGLLARARRRSGRRVRRHEGHARAVDHPRAARREDRHRRVVRGSDRVRHQRAQPGEGAARLDRRRSRARHGSGRRGQAAVAGDRQEGAERPAGRQADRLADRHQERGGEAPRGRGAVRGAGSRGRGRRGSRRRQRAQRPRRRAEAAPTAQRPLPYSARRHRREDGPEAASRPGSTASEAPGAGVPRSNCRRFRASASKTAEKILGRGRAARVPPADD